MKLLRSRETAMDGIVGTAADAGGGAIGGVGTERGAEAERASLEAIALANAELNDIAAAAQDARRLRRGRGGGSG